MPKNPEFYNPNGLNWDALRADYRTKASPEEIAMQDRTDRQIMEFHGWRIGGESRVIKTKPDAKKEPQNPGSSLPIDKRLEIVKDYNDGMKVSAIAVKHRLSERTTRAILVRANVYNPNRDRGGSHHRKSDESESA